MSWMKPTPVAKINSMTRPEMAKNLLEGKTCDTCGLERDEDDCCVWLGEDKGWAWVHNKGYGTCAYWEEL